MKYVNIIFLFFLSALLLNCSEIDKKNKVKVQVVKYVNSTNPILVSQFSKKPRFIKLKTPKDVFLGMVMKLRFSDDYVFYIERDRVHAFDTAGNFIFTIVNIGRGPGEFLSVRDLLYSEKNKTFQIVDNGTSKILTFDMKGKFVKEKFTKFYVESLSRFTNGDYVFLTSKFENQKFAGRILITDSNFTIKNAFLPETNQILPDKHITEYYNFLNYGDSVLFKHATNDTAYLITPNFIKPRYFFDFHKYGIPENWIEKLKMRNTDLSEYTNKIEKGKILCFAKLLKDTKNIFMFHTFYSSNINILKKSTHEILAGNNLFDDFHQINLFIGNFTGTEGVAVKEPSKMLKEMKKFREKVGETEWTNFLKLNPEYAALLKDMKPDDNPVLFFVEL